MTDLFTGAEALVSMLHSKGIRALFAYPGTSELTLCAAAEYAPGMQLINSWGDAEAVFMASGVNIATRNIAGSILHGARGLTNALGAIADSRRSEVGGIHLIGMPSRDYAHYLPPHAEPNLIQSAGAFSTAAFDTSELSGWDSHQYVSTINSALDALNTHPQGPVLLGLPQDLLEKRFVSELPIIPHSNAPFTVDLAKAREAIRMSKRPVILADDYALRDPQTELALGRFAEWLSAPVLQVAYRRGPMLFQRFQLGRIPTFLGLYDPEDRTHRILMESSDLLITVEDRNMYPRVVGRLPSCRKLAITSNAALTLKNNYVGADDLLLSGSVTGHLNKLAEQTSDYERPDVNMKTGAYTGTCGSATSLMIAFGRLVRQIKARLLIDDSQMFGGLVSNNYQVLPPDLRVHGSHGAFVGSGLSVAAGAAIASGGAPVVCAVGDHAFSNGVRALAAITDQAVPILIVVCNNGGAASLRLQSDAGQLPVPRDSRLLSNNRLASYSKIAEGYGIDSEVIHWPSCAKPGDGAQEARRLVAVAEQFESNPRPFLVELVTPIGDSDFWDGVWRTRGQS